MRAHAARAAKLRIAPPLHGRPPGAVAPSAASSGTLTYLTGKRLGGKRLLRSWSQAPKDSVAGRVTGTVLRLRQGGRPATPPDREGKDRTRPGDRARRATVLAVVATLCGSSLAACTGGDESVPPAPNRVSLNVPVKAEPNGEPVVLESSVFVPSGSGPFPAVILGHGFGGSMDGMAERARQLATRGYVVLTYSARGFGRSGGRIHLNSPDYEIADITELVDALGKRSDVLTDAAGDPRVGVVGTSYAGAASLMAAGADQRIDAVAATATWNDLGSVFYADATVPPDKVVRPGRPLPTPGGSQTADRMPDGSRASLSPGAAATASSSAPATSSPGSQASTANPPPSDASSPPMRRRAVPAQGSPPPPTTSGSSSDAGPPSSSRPRCRRRREPRKAGSRKRPSPGQRRPRPTRRRP